jgi:hypothetical protein
MNAMEATDQSPETFLGMIGQNLRATSHKSHDHKFVRARKKVFKGCPKPPPKSSSVVTDPQV